ncbi:MAG: tetratricopeptide repeat protein [Rikenellaceae bacterium]
MKRIFKISLFFSFFSLLAFSAMSADKADALKLWQKANKAYTQGDYKAAIDFYTKAHATGYDGVKLYYNMANAYYKDGNIGKAIVNYNRALRLAPGDEDIAYNLEIANAQTLNRIESLPEFILYTQFKKFRAEMSSNSWAFISLVGFALTLFFILVYLLSNTVTKRKISFSLACVMFAMFVFTISFASYQKHQITASSQAVVLSSAEAVKSSPDATGKDIFIINEGATVRVIDRLGEWSEVVVASGNSGWILTKAIEII